MKFPEVSTTAADTGALTALGSVGLLDHVGAVPEPPWQGPPPADSCAGKKPARGGPSQGPSLARLVNMPVSAAVANSSIICQQADKAAYIRLAFVFIPWVSSL